MKSKTLLVLFIAVTLVELISITMKNQTISSVVKIVLMPSLAAYYFTSEISKSTTLLSALACCWIGDILLLFQQSNELFFITGLVSFLIGHIFLILTYRNIRWAINEDPLVASQKARFALPILLASAGIINTLYPHLGAMKIPVIVYSIVITLMVLNSTFRYGRTSKSSYWLVFIGAFLFMTSDSIIAINKFQSPVPNSDILIMSTYIIAQFLIVEGLLQHGKSKPIKL
jgi:uncharacterized membrane protein YhhN